MGFLKQPSKMNSNSFMELFSQFCLVFVIGTEISPVHKYSENITLLISLQFLFSNCEISRWRVIHGIVSLQVKLIIHCSWHETKNNFTNFRFCGVLLPSISYVIYRNENVFPEGKRKFLMLRCIVGSLGLIFSFYAFQNMQLGDRWVNFFCW